MQVLGIYLLKLVQNKWFWVSVAVLIIVVFVIPKIFKNLTDPNKKRDEKNDQVGSNIEADKAIKELENEGMKASYSDAQYSIFCETLFQAVDGCGTDEQSVLGVIGRMKNDLDIVKMVDKYGVRKKTCMGVGTTGTLIQHLKSDFEDDTQFFNAVNSAAAAKGLKFRI